MSEDGAGSRKRNIRERVYDKASVDLQEFKMMGRIINYVLTDKSKRLKGLELTLQAETDW